jgi:BirA family transcriptional regulator, biotin operon repressor / biotin---[acetyl-CoA-carboxylase] ligase
LISISAAPKRYFSSVGSTNVEAKTLYDSGVTGPLWLIADEQTAGRGRLGRSWVSKPGNLYTTLLINSEAGTNHASDVSFLAAVAVHDAISAIKKIPNLKLKWPNDCLIDGAKVCGILPEVIGQAPLTFAIGCGINIAHAPENTPYPVTHLTAHSDLFTVDSMFEALALSLDSWWKIWNNGAGFSEIRAAWLDRCIGLNDTIFWQEKSGKFIDLAANGALIVELPNGTTTLIHSGEIRFAAVEKRRLETV